MRMESKYYTPKIEEFHVGFEYEHFYDQHGDENRKWQKTIVGEFQSRSYISMIENHLIRVKRLDQADIESLGFKLSYEEEESPNKMFTYGPHSLIWNPSCWCIITIRNEARKEDYTAYVGVIKNKSELKKIFNQLSNEL